MNSPEFPPTTPAPYVARSDLDETASDGGAPRPCRSPVKPLSVLLVQIAGGLLLLVGLGFGLDGRPPALFEMFGAVPGLFGWWILKTAVALVGIFASIGVQRGWPGARACGLVAMALMLPVAGSISFLGILWALVGGLVIPALVFCAVVVVLFLAWAAAFLWSPGSRDWFGHLGQK